MLFCIGLITSCSPEDTDGIEKSTSNDVFYAKYAVSFSAEPGAFRTTPKIVKITYNGGNISSNKAVKTYSWEGEYGPVKKGTTLFLNVSSTYGNTTRGTASDYYSTSIAVKKNNGSYTIVKSGTNNIKYIIQ